MTIPKATINRKMGAYYCFLLTTQLSTNLKNKFHFEFVKKFLFYFKMSLENKNLFIALKIYIQHFSIPSQRFYNKIKNYIILA